MVVPQKNMDGKISQGGRDEINNEHAILWLCLFYAFPNITVKIDGVVY